ncbi:hypothetical protein [Tessaracoccus massiliensis]|uniref:hypothetical protein n=1 Tax=Tessaracoccus massiliensis TaxID=1522311 RepID=UPI00058ECD24|nr:hypothetical protein [Tessaracoccus massiliensis]
MFLRQPLAQLLRHLLEVVVAGVDLLLQRLQAAGWRSTSTATEASALGHHLFPQRAEILGQFR